MRKRYRIFMTGGHLTPAVSVIEEIRSGRYPIDILFIGRKVALEGEQNFSQEYRTMQSLSVPFLPLIAGRLTRTFSFFSLVSVMKIPVGFIMAFWYVYRYRPDCIISFGGYLGLTTALAGWIFRIPVITHEQTGSLGLANRIISKFAKSVLLSKPPDLQGKISVPYSVIGLPVRRSLFHPPFHPSLNIPLIYPILYITGGNTGAKSMNEKIFPIISDLTSRYTVMHQTGDVSYQSAIKTKHALSGSKNEHYFPERYLHERDVSWLYQHAALIIGRSGANTVEEIRLAGVPALFIPLPWSASGEQQKNAQSLVDLGRAIQLSQDTLMPETILSTVDRLILTMHRLKPEQFVHAKKSSAASLFVDEILRVLETS